MSLFPTNIIILLSLSEIYCKWIRTHYLKIIILVIHIMEGFTDLFTFILYLAINWFIFLSQILIVLGLYQLYFLSKVLNYIITNISNSLKDFKEKFLWISLSHLIIIDRELLKEKIKWNEIWQYYKIQLLLKIKWIMEKLKCIIFYHNY